ncbi:hypothetical protein A5725_07260 [Mycobacterium kubicae]|uniref:GNAT family N-acetyltransferase, cg3035/Rv0428c family n=1 Tax=Mycobacterium kubicae TaxID=120959 RepID=UPI0007FEC18B|nr:hypothetical protein [Mycobacterium kubicae]OBF24395.1 hypothetical protein A5725_07260 [Mycobacterium kubicae]
MVSWPSLGTRVTVRYRRPLGSAPPLTDAVGQLLAVEPVVRVQTKSGAIVSCSPSDVVALRVLTDTVVRTADIRNLEHAAAAAIPGLDREWLDGWLLRAGTDVDPMLNSAVPLDRAAHAGTLPGIVDWYRRRDLPPRLAIPERLLTPPAGLVCERTDLVMVRELSSVTPQTPTADGEPAVTTAPDGTRWLGLSTISLRNHGAAPLASGAGHGATRAVVRAHKPDDIALAEELGFTLHHRSRYFAVPASR